jgi:hypothetical protein
MSVDLELTSTLKNDHVKRGETVVVLVELKNRSSAPLAVNGRLGLSAPKRGGDVSLEIRDQAGKEVPLSARINIGRPADTDFRVLAPQASASREIKVTDYFQLRPGTYAIRAVYENAHDRQVDGTPAWRGTLQSNEVRLEIK